MNITRRRALWGWTVRAGLAALLLSASGCQSWIKPTADARAGSFSRHGSALRVDPDRLKQSTYLVLADEAEFQLQLEREGDRVRFLNDTRRDGRNGLAVALTHDGYLLTAGHVAQSWTYVLGRFAGEIQLQRARLVTQAFLSPYGSEYALLKVDGPLDAPVALAPVQAGEAVFAVGMQWQEPYGPIVLAGVVREVRQAETETDVRRLSTTVPLWYGDSGGPVFNADGALLGVNTAFQWRFSLPRSAYDRFVCAPAATLVEALIEADRRQMPRTEDVL